MLDYLDLNKRARKSREKEQKAHALEQRKEIQEQALSAARQVVMYFGVFIGVLLSEAVHDLGTGRHIKISLTVGKVIVSALIALIVVPYVYEKLRPESPFIVQFGLFVQNGVFWSFILNLIGKTF